MNRRIEAKRATFAARLGRWLVVGFCVVLSRLSAFANPQGMSVVQGNVTSSTSPNGAQLNVTTTSANAVINWSSFNIAAGETTTFVQPSSVSVVWNQIFDHNPSQIWGSLNANGIVVLMNQNGFYLGPNSSVNVGGFIASTAPVAAPTPSGSGMWQFQGAPPMASILNYGTIKTHSGGPLFLIAEAIENHGTLSAPDGTVGLYAGKEVMVSERPDGRGLSAKVVLPAGSVNNQGQIIADGGIIALNAQVVNQNGLIQANSVRNQSGIIELVASDAVNLGPNSVIRANGDSTVASMGGQITIKSAGSFADDPASQIEVKGGALGGDGGSVEVSAPQMSEVLSQLDGSAQAGWLGGSLLLDPYNIVLASSGSSGSVPSSGTVPWNGPPSASGSTLTLNVNSAFLGFSQILLQATHNISLNAGTVWNLNASTGISGSGSLLTLEAGNNIVFGNNSRIVSSGGWSVNLMAGANFSLPTVAPQPGVGGIYLNGGPTLNYNGAIETTDGNITLAAGHEILVGKGYVRTVGGGNISVMTGDGDVNAGTDAATFDFSQFGYTISANGLGGIGTADGGNVTINAGRDIISYNATIGAFGGGILGLGGNVDLTAGRDIMGRFMLINGTGTLQAGRDVGSAATPISLGLASGGWNVYATRDLYLNELYNPNGSQNPNKMLFGAGVTYQFDYAPDAYANLVAGNSVNLIGHGIVHGPGNTDRSPIYAPILDITAGAGGVVLDNDVVLYPSPLGSLNITTTDGGSLVSAAGGYYRLIISDSGSPSYRSFANGHASTPLHLGGIGAGVHLDISGDIQNLYLQSPEAADIHVHGNTLNFSFQGQNLSGSDVTRLQIDGDCLNRSDSTSVTLADAADLSALTDPILSANPQLAARLVYDPTTHKLTIEGIMTAADLNFLLNPVICVLDPATGAPLLDANGEKVTQAAPPITTDIAALNQLYQATQDVPASTLAYYGLRVGGPGQFFVSANNMNLGTSQGIQSVGAFNNPALAQVLFLGSGIAPLPGASLIVNLSGNLAMGSSQIASFNGGNITVASLGSIDLGSQDPFTSDTTPRGIYTGHGGNIAVTAVGNIELNGSRIASYDGGDVTVISQTGDVNAGAGGNGFFYVTTSQIDPVTGQPIVRTDEFFGSGIMALTRPDSTTLIGNITVQAGQDIIANSGGIIQLSFNTTPQTDAHLTLTAARDIIADQSGVMGYNPSISAGGKILGLFVAAGGNMNFVGKTIDVTAVAPGTITATGDSISGELFGGSGISASGESITASMISNGAVSTSGDSSGAKTGAFTGVTAPTVQKTTDNASDTVAKQELAQNNDDDEQKKRAAKPALSKSVGRVTVILPKG